MMNILKFTFLFFVSLGLVYSQKLEKLGSAINTEYNELHPVISPDGETLYFARESHPSNNHAKKGSIDVWFSNLRSDGRWSIARKMPNTVNKSEYNDLFCITPDGNKILINGVYKRGRKQSGEVGLSLATRTKSGWTQPEKLEIPKLDKLVKGRYLLAYLSNSGKTIIFSFSTKKNSTNDDLYASFMDKNGFWSKPISLGSKLNTNGAETTPFLASDDRTLYFSSDRKGGLGGMDIWAAKREGKGWDNWSEPVNLGEKVNSEDDEYYYSMTATGEYAYMATKNQTVGKGDIIRFKLIEDKPKGPVIASLQGDDSDDEKDKPAKKPTKEDLQKEVLTAPNPVVMLSGKVVDVKTGQPLEAKVVYETFPRGEEIGVASTNPVTGKYKIVLPYGQRYSVRAITNDFISIAKTIDLSEVGQYQEMNNEDLEMAPLLPGVTVNLSNIFFQFGKATLEEESFLELNRLADVLKEKKTMVIEVQGHTDDVGQPEANLKLSQERANSVRDYLVSQQVPIEKVQSAGFGESRPIASNKSTEGQAKNRRVEFVIVKK